MDLEDELDRILGRDLDHRLALRLIHSTAHITAAALLVHLRRLDVICVQRQRAQRNQQARDNIMDLLHRLTLPQFAVRPRIAHAPIGAASSALSAAPADHSSGLTISDPCQPKLSVASSAFLCGIRFSAFFRRSADAAVSFRVGLIRRHRLPERLELEALVVDAPDGRKRREVHFEAIGVCDLRHQ